MPRFESVHEGVKVKLSSVYITESGYGVFVTDYVSIWAHV